MFFVQTDLPSERYSVSTQLCFLSKCFILDMIYVLVNNFCRASLKNLSKRVFLLQAGFAVVHGPNNVLTTSSQCPNNVLTMS